MRDVARTLKVFQQGFNYSQDGRGNRLVLHLQGCNMHCPWCSNPEGMPVRGALMTEKEWLTENCCPKGAVRNGSLDRSVCEDCADIARKESGSHAEITQWKNWQTAAQDPHRCFLTAGA